MSDIPKWLGSPEEAESKKEAAGYLGRILTVKADLARIQPKLSTYKKETLERLARETKVKYDLVSKLNASMHSGDQSATSRYVKRFEAARSKGVAAINKRHQDELKSFQVECDQVDETYMAYHKSKDHPKKATNDLAVEYRKLLEILNSELKKAQSEKPPNPARKV